ncbi:hypothetical protein T439DRAFT_377515 [Meredithblackwellia eburnea MCA 4105]
MPVLNAFVSQPVLLLFILPRPIQLFCLLLLFSTSAFSAPLLFQSPPYRSESHPDQRLVRRGQPSLKLQPNPYPGGTVASELSYPGGLARNIPTRNIHSHNDYWRDVPLYTALSLGVRSIEADVWLNPKDGVLYVGHSYIFLTKARTFDHLYVSQLLHILSLTNVRDDEYQFFNETDFFSPENEREVRRESENWFDEGSDARIRLVVDLKTRGLETYHALRGALEPLREKGWLTTYTKSNHTTKKAPVEVVMTGNGNNLDVRSLLVGLEETDLFMDAPLLSLNETWVGADGKTHTWDPVLAPLASTSFSSLTPWTGRLPIVGSEFSRLFALFEVAKARGFQVRVYSPPRWPTFVRDRVWRTLWEAGTDFMDADELEDMAAF